jgi:hypothetical protein
MNIPLRQRSARPCLSILSIPHQSLSILYSLALISLTSMKLFHDTVQGGFLIGTRVGSEI